MRFELEELWRSSLADFDGGMVDCGMPGADGCGLGRMDMVSVARSTGRMPRLPEGPGRIPSLAIPHEKSGTRRSRFQH